MFKARFRHRSVESVRAHVEAMTAEGSRFVRFLTPSALSYGAQSGSERVLEAMKRGHGVDDVVRAVQLCVEAGLRPEVDLLLGFPGEMRVEREASLGLAERLVAMGARIHSHAMLPLPGTPTRDAIPEPIEEPVARQLARLESRGASWGQWRRQVVAAERLVEGRRRRS